MNSLCKTDIERMSALAVEAAKSEDPVTQVAAAVYVDGERRAVGHNRFPAGIASFSARWVKVIKKTYVLHAELNVLLSSGPCENGTLYSTLYPCPACALAIIEQGISRVVYRDFRDYPDSENLFKEAGVEVVCCNLIE